MSGQAIFSDSPSAISSPASASGLSLFEEPDGQMTFLFGPAVAPASLSARQALEVGLRTQGISGQLSPGSSGSESLQSSLESRLQARLSNLGSTLYTLTWKPWITPLGPSRSRLRASARRTSETDFSGWVTPTTRDHKDTPGMVAQRDGADRVDQLPRQAYLCGWPTPLASNTNGGMANRGMRMDGRDRGPGLHDLAKIVGPARLTDCGQLLTGSSAEMPSGAQLNPAHSRWLMGLPAEWDACAPTETPSMLKRQRNS